VNVDEIVGKGWQAAKEAGGQAEGKKRTLPRVKTREKEEKGLIQNLKGLKP